ncbi:MAG: hypothetical protein HY785_27875 [Oscillatoriophycideae cyanobacterium NC_groundwater_1537_Pr4_S-0.65um_50_18]|nr:hypothetical protein [Oscillatoriophycideae cyanobacterium NC_groundwater_1537_Pr4_S-0.65um_50_18]
MTTPPRIKCVIPQSWQTALEALAQQTGKSVEQVVYEAIAQYLNPDLNPNLSPDLNKTAALDKQPSVPAEALTQMQSQIHRLENRLAKTDLAIMQTAALAARVVAIEQTLRQMPNTSAEDKLQPLEDEPEEEFEDEPDEILVGFLESDDFQDRLQQAIDPASSRSTSYASDSDEDEPGEILYDFIEP